MRDLLTFLTLTMLAGLLAGAANVSAAPAGLSSGPAKSTPPLPPLPPMPPSPIDYFRQLLDASSAERDQMLTNRSAYHRRVLERSLRVYEQLPLAEREIRLRTMELRHYFNSVLLGPDSNRLARLASVPDPYRLAVIDRLQYWDALPADVQRQVQDYERLTRSLVPGSVRSNAAALSMEVDLHRLLPNPHRSEVQKAFQRIFETTAAERADILRQVGDKMTRAEREQMEKTMASFWTMPKLQRDRAIEGFRKFTGLSAQEQRLFLRNAAVWEKMGAEDRQKWRDVVAKLPPMPPMPPGFGLPPLPPMPRPLPPPALATNGYGLGQ